MAPSRPLGVARYSEFFREFHIRLSAAKLAALQSLLPASLRIMGHPSLCGALFAAYQSNSGDLCGEYMLCALFKAHMLLALPQKSSNFSVVAIINTGDIQLVDADNGRGK